MRITPQYMNLALAGTVHTRFALMDNGYVLHLNVNLPYRSPDHTWFFLTFIGFNYYAFWAGEEELFQCWVS